MLFNYLILISFCILIYSCKQSVGGTYFNEYVDLPYNYNVIDKYISEEEDSTYIKIEYKQDDEIKLVQKIQSHKFFDDSQYIDNPWQPAILRKGENKVICKSKDGFVVQRFANNKLFEVIELDTNSNWLIYDETKFPGRTGTLTTTIFN